MMVALIIVSIFLVFSLLGNIVFFRIFKEIANDIMEEQQFEQELAFIEGKIDIPENEIEKKFLNATLLYHIQKNPYDNSNTWKLVDTSNYQKNRVIGLTYFIQPQLFKSINMDKIKEKIYNKFDDDDDDIDEEFVDKMLNRTMEELLSNGNTDKEYETVSYPFLSHCTVYQLKDGRWLWRQESY